MLLWSLVLLALGSLVSAQDAKIDVLLGPNEDARLSANHQLWSGQRTHFKRMQAWSTPEVGREICMSAREGSTAVAIIGLPPRMSANIASYSDYLQLPLVTDTVTSGNLFHLGVKPDATRAAMDYARSKGWNDCAFIYDTDHGAHQLNTAFTSKGFSVGPLYRVHSAQDALTLLLSPRTNVSRAFLAMDEKMANDVMAGMPARKHFHAILLDAVGSAKIPSWLYGSYTLKITKFSYLNNMALQQEVERKYMLGQTANQIHIPDSAWMLYDSGRVLERVLALQLSRPKTDCFNNKENYTSEPIFFNRKLVSTVGVSGPIDFDEEGLRRNYTLRIIEMIARDHKHAQQVGIWSSDSGLQTPHTAAYRTSEAPLRATSILNRPFLMRRESDGQLEGYVVDLVRALELEIDRNINIQIVKDGKYGLLVPYKGWNGMIGEVIRGEADFVVGDLTKTAWRGEAVDYTKTFLNLGINILMKRPPHQHHTAYFAPFGFLNEVWPADLYLVLGCAVLLAGLVCYGLSRFLGVPDRVRALESKGTDNLSPCGSLWYTVASLMQRDAGIYPRTLSHRLWSLLWRFFCLICVLCYAASLTAALVRARTTMPDTTTLSRTTSHQLLEGFLRTGYPDIGMLKFGSTYSFFALSSNPNFQRLGAHQLSGKAGVSTYAEGVKRVKESDGGYAFVMESVSSEFVSSREPCDTVATSGYFTTKSYALAVKKNETQLRNLLDKGVLNLLERGTLRRLFEKWWHNFTDHCQDPNHDILPRLYTSSLTLYEVSGVYYLMIILLAISLASIAVEHFVVARRRAVTIQ